MDGRVDLGSCHPMDTKAFRVSVAPETTADSSLCLNWQPKVTQPGPAKPVSLQSFHYDCPSRLPASFGLCTLKMTQNGPPMPHALPSLARL